MTAYTIGQIGLNFRGPYTEEATYNKQDVVSFWGSSYVAMANNLTGDAPMQDPEEDGNYSPSANWQILCEGFEGKPEPIVPTLEYGTTSDTVFGNGQLRWRKVGNHVYISGGVQAKYTGSGKVLMNLPADAAPLHNSVIFLRACSGGRVARVFVNTAGEFYLEWIKNMSDGSNYTSAAIWIDCNLDYWTD